MRVLYRVIYYYHTMGVPSMCYGGLLIGGLDAVICIVHYSSVFGGGEIINTKHHKGIVVFGEDKW